MRCGKTFPELDRTVWRRGELRVKIRESVNENVHRQLHSGATVLVYACTQFVGIFIHQFLFERKAEYHSIGFRLSRCSESMRGLICGVYAIVLLVASVRRLKLNVLQENNLCI